MESQRCPVGNHRVNLATQTPRRWSLSTLAGHTSCARWGPVGFGYRSSAIEAIVLAICDYLREIHRNEEQCASQASFGRLLDFRSHECNSNRCA
jgi:hypothetical protein